MAARSAAAIRRRRDTWPVYPVRSRLSRRYRDAVNADPPSHPGAEQAAPAPPAQHAEQAVAEQAVAEQAEHAEQAELVRRGYDALSYLYRADDAGPGQYGPWLDRLLALLPPAADVLDLGCGCGVPVARELAGAGHRVTGVDISAVQVGRARELVPAATFIQADATQAGFGDDSFDAIVSFYALIHMPLAAQPGLLKRAGQWLRPSGWLLAVTGRHAWTGTEDRWLGGTAPMHWSQADAAASRRWLTEAGLEITGEERVPDGNSEHALFWARRPVPGHGA
jgi:SAM-dependent methyltransferase